MAAPSTAQVIINIDGKVISVNPPNFVSFKMTRLAGDTCNSFTLQVLDSSAFELEYALLNGVSGNISFEYKDYEARSNGNAPGKNVYKKFAGFVIKMSDSFVDNRVMLTLEGFVGVSLSDKFDKISFAWNTVPKFNWSDVFTDASNSLFGGTNDANKDDSWFENVGNWFKNFWGSSWSGLSMLVSVARGDSSLDQMIYKSIGHNTDEAMQLVIDNIKVDEAGNYYLPNRKFTTNYSIDSLDTSKNIKQSGTITIPMKPSKIIKLIAAGGAYSSLLEEDFENYKGTAFYNGSGKVSELDWIFIKMWFKKMGSFPGCGWKLADANIEDTDLVQVDFTQTKQSFLQYINKVLVPNSRITETYTREVVRDGKTYKQNVDRIKTNFLLTFDNDGYVYFKRISLSNNEPIKATYYVYGNGDVDSQKAPNGQLTSFSATLDVLTSMISNNTFSGGDISNLNLVTGEVNQDIEVEVETEDDADLRMFTEWGSMRVSVARGSVSDTTEAKALGKIQEEAQKQCYEANITVEGPCNLSPQDYIQIIVVPNSTEVLYHHTSGVYYILRIDDTIEGGRQYSNIKLVKNVTALGTTTEEERIASEKEIKYISSSKPLEIMTQGPTTPANKEWRL